MKRLNAKQWKYLWVKLKDRPYSQVLAVLKLQNALGSMVEAEMGDCGRGCGNPRSDEDDKLKFTHYEKTRRTRDTCWDLVGHPRQNFPRANSATKQ
ncbi:hypothetical protein AMTR_s00014p00023700 [Amborella trichopoda]|uniref:Uncharacterized protein n=1 Tax=Amborella trichopoda TaxID=13333 RepID=W1PMZ2_AMBTC|nr:hypothetical protein AMTR_s00014p00023700 [Amborella trichopoda]